MIGKEFEILIPEKEQIIQPNLLHPTEKQKMTRIFWEDYEKFGCEYILRRYCECNPNQEYELIERKQYIKRLVRKVTSMYHRVFVTE